MVGKRSPAAQVAVILMWWTVVMQAFSVVSIWLFVMRGAVEVLYPLALGAGALGLAGLPFGVAALRTAGRGDLHRAGTWAMISSLVSLFSVTAFAAAMFALFSPESRAASRVREDSVPHAMA